MLTLTRPRLPFRSAPRDADDRGQPTPVATRTTHHHTTTDRLGAVPHTRPFQRWNVDARTGTLRASWTTDAELD